MEVNLTNFTLLHNHLMSILSTNNYQQEHLPQKIMQYIGMIVESQKHSDMAQDFFDFFCENGGNKILKLTLQVEPLLSVRILSMLFINLRSQNWISYLLCQPFITDAIQYQDIPKQEEWPEYYISLLKSLSIRLNAEQLSLFYNKKFAKFPLLYESLKYYNHPDCMVRTNVMNIILGIMKIKDQRLSKYFGRFPFTSYVLTYVCQIKQRICKLNDHLKQLGQNRQLLQEKQYKQKHKSIIKMYFIDMIDYIQYLNDLMELGCDQLAYFVRNCIFAYIVLPFLKHLQPTSQPLLISSTVFLIFTLFKTITDQQFKSNLCLLLLGRQLPKCILTRIQTQTYIPKVYSQIFNPNKYYWNKYSYQVQRECLKLFNNVNNFEIEHENKQQNVDQTNSFMEQIKKISQTLGFDILNYSAYDHTASVGQLCNIMGFVRNSKQQEMRIQIRLDQGQKTLVNNPLRYHIFNILQSSITDINKDSLVLSIVSMINSFGYCETTDNQILQFCGILQPRLDTVNYEQQYNKNSIDNMIATIINFIKYINQNSQANQTQEGTQTERTRKDNATFSIVTIKNAIILLNDCIYEKLSEQYQAHLKQLYKNSILQIKQLVIKRNMKYLVQKFEVQYTKMLRQALFPNNNLPQSVLSIRKSIKEICSQQSGEQIDDANFSNRLYFKTAKQQVIYHIQKFSFLQTFYLKYLQKYGKLEQVFHQKYHTLHNQKYNKIQEILKVGHSYHIGYRHMVQCMSQQKKVKTSKKWIIVEDKHNLIIVEPSLQEDKAKILANHPWKYVEAEIDRETGRKMSIKFHQCVRGDAKIEVHFQTQARSAGTLEWMNSLKYQRYQSQQAFILQYVKQCLNKM